MTNGPKAEWRYHSSHFGTFRGRAVDGGLQVRAEEIDPDPSPLIKNFEGATHHPARIDRPYIRRRWLQEGPGTEHGRGQDEFVAVSWAEAIETLADELARVYADHGPGGIFGGSYGWSSAGRFHHAQSQIHRFLNVLGGYVRSINTYSSGAAEVVLPHVVGSHEALIKHANSWEDLAQHTELLVCFGGLPLKNGAVNSGGVTQHTQAQWLRTLAENGCRFVLISPLQDDLMDELDAQWLRPRPGSDLALMIGLAGELVQQELVDRAFVERYCSGFEEFEQYLTDDKEGPKDAEWAAELTGLSAESIRLLARQLGRAASMITCSYSLQRIQHGEQLPWMGLILSAMTGGLGQPGRGFAHGLGAVAGNGQRIPAVPFPSFPQGSNPCREFIPVARIADMLLDPGSEYEYNGATLTFPSPRLVYWAGGNPFHHHQNLFRLREAFRRPETVVVHESVWTSTARHADIVLPATMSPEREDIAAARYDSHIVPMHQLTSPYAEALDDYEIFSRLADRLGVKEQFTENRSARQWLRVLYAQWLDQLAKRGLKAPSFDEFWETGPYAVPLRPPRRTLEEFIANPAAHRLPTRSGRIEVTSETIREFGYEDCPAHPTWQPPREWLKADRARDYPLHLIANQPEARLHSQLDFGPVSADHKRNGREILRIHPQDAQPRGLDDGDVVRVWNERGTCFAAAEITERVMRQVVRLPTGAWFDPQQVEGVGEACVHGNPNVLTADAGTSRLAQGCTGQHVLVQVEKWEAPLPPVAIHAPPQRQSI